MKDELGDRIKSQYEDRTRYSLPRRTYTMIRMLLIFFMLISYDVKSAGIKAQIEGQVFVTMKKGESAKLSSVPVFLITSEELKLVKESLSKIKATNLRAKMAEESNERLKARYMATTTFGASLMKNQEKR